MSTVSHPALHTLEVGGSAPTSAGGASLSDLGDLGKILGGVASGVGVWLESIARTFSGTAPNRSDYQSTVITIIILGLLLALALVSVGSVVKLANAVKP